MMQPELKRVDPQELMAAQSRQVVQPGEAMLELYINGQLLRYPVRWGREMVFQILPLWMRDSTVPPPEPDKEAAKQGLNKNLLELMRSGIKNLIRLKLGTLMRFIYGPDERYWPFGVKMPHGRDDILPVIDRMIIDFIVGQVYQHPLYVDYDETTGLVTSFRPGNRLAPAVDADNPTGAASTAGTGSQGRSQDY